MNQFSRLREFLNLQLASKRFKKSDLIDAYHKLGYSFGETITACKKQEIAEAITSLILQDLNVLWKKLLPLQFNEEQLMKEISKQLEAKLQVFNLRGISINKKIYDIFNLETLSHSNQMSSNRQIKVYQEPVENIWITNTKVIQCLCPKAPSNLQQSKKIETCYRCLQKYHSQCFWSPEKGQQIYECPFCYLKFCMPQKQVKQILFGGYLPIMKKQKVQYKINFALDPKTKADRSVILQARCVKFNSKNRFQISWPDSCAFSLGKNRISQFKPLPTSSPLKRRADQAIKLDKSRLQVDNQIIIEQRYTAQNGFKLNKKCYHLVAIMVISQLPNQSVLTKMQRNFISISESKQQLTRHMSHEKGDILIQKIAISLRCQYFGGKMKLPARSRLCNTHIQPFDLMNFINSSIHAKSSTRRWKCPICDKRAYDLVIDKYILELMRENPNVNEIVFRQNGQHQMIQAKQDQLEELNQSDGERGKGFYQLQKRERDKTSIIINIDDEDDFPQNPVRLSIGWENKKQKQSIIFGKIPNSSMVIQSEGQNEKVKQMIQEKEGQKQKVKQKEQLRKQQKEQNKEKEDGLKGAKILGNNLNKNSNVSSVTGAVSGVAEKKNSQYQRYDEEIELKKIRKLNDGNLQLSVKGKKNQTKIIPNEPVLILSSDQEERPPKIIISKPEEMPVLEGTSKKLSKDLKQSSSVNKPSQVPKQAQPDSKQLSLTVNQKKGQVNKKVPQVSKQNVSWKGMQGKNRQLIIDIESDEEEEKQEKEKGEGGDAKSVSQLSKLRYEQIMNLHRGLQKQGKVEITEEDTDQFEILYNKLLLRCE